MDLIDTKMGQEQKCQIQIQWEDKSSILPDERGTTRIPAITLFVQSLRGRCVPVEDKNRDRSENNGT